MCIRDSVVGFRVLTSDSRRAIRRLSERLGITPVPLESMIDQPVSYTHLPGAVAGGAAGKLARAASDLVSVVIHY